VSALAGGNLNYLLPGADMVGTFPNGGTSAATPQWATLVSQFNFIFADQGLPQLGYMNDLLYIASAIAPASFNDITLGNNISSFVAGQGTYQNDGAAMPTGFGYFAGPGYDLVTGLGTPNGVLLGRALSAIAHEQMYFDSVPDVLNLTGSGWVSGVNQTLSLQAMSNTAVTLGLTLGGTAIGASSGPSASFAWTSQFAEQVLQPDFDQALVRLFDKQSQAFAMQSTLGAGQSVAVDDRRQHGARVQGGLTADFGFADFINGQGVVRVAQAVMVAEDGGRAERPDGRSCASARTGRTIWRSPSTRSTTTPARSAPCTRVMPAMPRPRRTGPTSSPPAGTAIGGPGYGNFEQAAMLRVNAGELIAQTLTDRTTGHTYWAFAVGNEANVVHQWNYGLNVVGWEDMYGGGDFDFNDLVVGVDFTSAYGHGWLV
jgi:hypothetical protein